MIDEAAEAVYLKLLVGESVPSRTYFIIKSLNSQQVPSEVTLGYIHSAYLPTLFTGNYIVSKPCALLLVVLTINLLTHIHPFPHELL